MKNWWQSRGEYLNLMDEMYSRSGDRILRINSTYLCSRVDPRKEARVWVEAQHIQSMTGFGLIVLGAGAGYHLAELRRRFPLLRVTIFEDQIRSRRMAEQLFPLELFDIPMFGSDDISLAWSHPVVKKILSGRFKVLVHPPSVNLNLAWYEQVKADLLGRSPRGLRIHFSCRPGFENIETFKDLNSPVTWKYFDQLPPSDFAHLSDRDYYLVRALRELIR